MRFAVAIFACVLAVANAQFGFPNNRFSSGRYQYNQGQYNQGQYNQGQYNPFSNSRYNNYNRYQAPTAFPPRPVVAKATASVSATPAPVAAPTPVPVVPFVPAVPAVSVPVAPVTVARVAADARSAETVKYGNDINPDGSYSYFYETNNGIAAQEQGTPRNFGGNPPLVPDVAQGSFSWISPEGKTVSVTYVADENGYQPQSDALPVPPPLPPQIARALEYISRNAKN